MSDRRSMKMSDWVVWVVLFAVGAMLGIAVVVWVGLDEPAFLQTIIYWFIPIGFLNIFIFFLSEVSGPSMLDKTSSTPQDGTRKLKPMPLLFSLPAGFIIGAVWARFGLSGGFL